MNEEKIKTTPIWNIYEECKNFAYMNNMFSENDKHNRFFNGNQWEGLKVKGVEPVQLNFIKPVIKFKYLNINQNLLSINYSADNFENEEFREVAKKTCQLLNQRASKVWEINKMDDKLRKISKKAAITSEGIIYFDYDEETDNPVGEVLNKVDVFYGNENDEDIQNQPYIIIKQRKPLSEVIRIAKDYGVDDKDIKLIIPDKLTQEESGDSSKFEKDDMVTFITKLWKEDTEDGLIVHFEKATKYCVIKESSSSGLSNYPLVHFVWEEKEGSARGEGEVKYLIPNQIEVNKTILRRLIAVKNTAYPQKVYKKDAITNPSAVSSVGGNIAVEGMDVDDVRKAFTITQPAQMSTDVEKLLNDLIQTTRELANASDVATGNINNTTLQNASGRAILAVQQAANESNNEQEAGLKSVVEDIGRIWLDMWKTYSNESLILTDTETDEQTGEEVQNPISVPASVLEQLQATIKIDITPRSAFDRYAQEQSYENLLMQKLISLEEFIDLIPYDTVWDKPALQEMIKNRKEAQRRITEFQNKGLMLQQQIRKQMDNGDIVPSVSDGGMDEIPETGEEDSDYVAENIDEDV